GGPERRTTTETRNKKTGDKVTSDEVTMTDDEQQPTPHVIEAEGFSLPDQPAPKLPSLPLVRDVLIRVPARHNARLQKIIERVNQDDELYMFWRCANINAVDRLGMSDHGPVHVQIV